MEPTSGWRRRLGRLFSALPLRIVAFVWVCGSLALALHLGLFKEPQKPYEPSPPPTADTTSMIQDTTMFLDATAPAYPVDLQTILAQQATYERDVTKAHSDYEQALRRYLQQLALWRAFRISLLVGVIGIPALAVVSAAYAVLFPSATWKHGEESKVETHAALTLTPVNGSAQWTTGLLIAAIVLAAFGIISSLVQVDILTRAGQGNFSQTEAAASDARQQLIGLLQVLVGVGSGVSFLIWFYRARRNLSALAVRDFNYTRGWAVWGF